jgi:hypothetical protein
VLAYVPVTPAWRHRRKVVRCRESAAHIQELVDSELSPEALEREVRVHVHECPPCATDEAVYRELKLAIVRVSQRCDAELADRLRQAALDMCTERHAPPKAE